MKTIVVASANPVKVTAALDGFRRLFPQEEIQARSISVYSGIRAQPLSDEETFQGALNRVLAAQRADPQADFWLGLEGGVAEVAGDLVAFAWVVITDGTRIGTSRTGTFSLPAAVVELIRQGVELGEADDIVFQRSNSKQTNGAIGLLTGDVVDRAELYHQSVILALVPFLNPQWYPLESNAGS